MSFAGNVRMVLFWTGSLGVALVSYRFLVLDLQLAFPDMVTHITQRHLVFIAHISAAPIALALGLFQFLPRLRAKRPALHRWSGRIYAVAILIGGTAGLALALGSLDRPAAASGFGLLAVIWLGVTARAVFLARAGRISEHRRWMIRSYALTFAAVTLRLFLPFFFIVLDMDYRETSNYVAWLCWVPNLIFAEYYLTRRNALQPA